jgi:hypothetical protein
MSFAVAVDCQPGQGGESVPHVLHFGPARVTVTALVDRWNGQDHRYFKLLGEDDATWIVRNDLPSGPWELAFYDSGPGPAR